MREYDSKRTRQVARVCCREAVFVVAALVALGLSRAAPAASQCPVPRYDAQSTGRTSAHATYNPVLEWSVATNCSFTPVIGANGALFFGTTARCFYAYTSDGTVQWTYRTSTSIGGSAALGSDGSVYLGVTGQLIALSNTGSPLWADPFRFSGTASPTSVQIGRDGTLYFGTNDYNVYAVNPDGTSKWSFNTGSAVRYSPSLSPDGSTVYVTSGDGRVYALESSNGTLKWKTAAISAIYNPAVADDGTVYVGSINGKLYAFTASGSQKWAFQAQSKVTCAPAVAADGTIYFGSQDANLYALDATGAKKWYYRTGGAIYSAPTLDATGVAIFSAWPGTLTALNSLGGVSWTRTLSANAYSPVVIDSEGSVYALGTDGAITKFSGPQHPEPSSVMALGSLLVAFGGVSLRGRRQKR